MIHAEAKNHQWVAVQGCIRTVTTFSDKTACGVKIKTPLWVAFNLKPELAEHIVKLHNEALHA
jgi:hypothetical protein